MKLIATSASPLVVPLTRLIRALLAVRAPPVKVPKCPARLSSTVRTPSLATRLPTVDVILPAVAVILPAVAVIFPKVDVILPAVAVIGPVVAVNPTAVVSKPAGVIDIILVPKFAAEPAAL